MKLTMDEIAKMLDLSCVRTTSDKTDIETLVQVAKTYRVGQISVLQSFIPLAKQLTADDPDIGIVGNVGFPSGSDATTIKVAQTLEMVEAGCREIDVVMNIGKLRSGDFGEVEDDLRAVIAAAGRVPVKVIIEMMYLDPEHIRQACEICIKAGASYVKTGTGWATRGTTVEDVKLIKSIVGDRTKIKASGGIRSLDSLVRMYLAGASRFGVNLKSGLSILEECKKLGGVISISE